MTLNNTYFETKKVYEPLPIPEQPGYVPPVVPIPDTPDPGSVPSITPPVFSGNVSIQFYVCSSDDDVLEKNITASGSAVNVVIKDSTRIDDFTIPFNDSSLIGVNYAQTMGKYYFCTPILDKGNLTAIHFSVDALMTHKDAIKGLYAIVDRTGNQFNTYLNDSDMKITSYTNIHRIESTSGLSQNLNYYLLTVGL